MENIRYKKNGKLYDQLLAHTKAENSIEYLQDTINNPEPDEPQKNIPDNPEIENDPTRIEPGINETVKNDPTRIDDLPPVFSEKYF